MTSERAGYMSVQSGLLRETLVEDLFSRAEDRRKDALPEATTAVLEAEDQELADPDERTLELQLRHAGYATRLVEAELFEAARQPADWIADVLADRFAQTGSWSRAVSAVCGDLARAEPVKKPSPDDEAAVSWRVPGPGGHVRHYVARRAIEDYLQDRGFAVPGDPAELKRPWLYGFLVRACEESLGPDATLDDGEDN